MRSVSRARVLDRKVANPEAALLHVHQKHLQIQIGDFQKSGGKHQAKPSSSGRAFSVVRKNSQTEKFSAASLRGRNIQDTTTPGQRVCNRLQKNSYELILITHHRRITLMNRLSNASLRSICQDAFPAVSSLGSVQNKILFRCALTTSRFSCVFCRISKTHRYFRKLWWKTLA